MNSFTPNDESIIIDHELAKPLKGVSLYDIERGLAELIEYRTQWLLDKDPPTSDELRDLDAEIKRYEITEPRKVAGVVATLRMWEAQDANAEEEIQRLRKIKGQIAVNRDRLKAHVKAALEMLPEPRKGPRSLTGYEGSKLWLQNNGGEEPLTVYNQDLLPDEMINVRVEIPFTLWLKLCSAGMTKELLEELDPKTKSITPNNKRIRDVLEAPCQHCGGLKFSEDSKEPDKRCTVCGGTGRGIVPGARLEQRGTHVRCR